MAPLGDCYGWANNFARELAKKANNVKIMHGTVTDPDTGESYQHAWVEYAGLVFDYQNSANNVFPTIEEFYDYAKPTDIKVYTPEEGMINMLKYQHHGPWEQEAAQEDDDYEKGWQKQLQWIEEQRKRFDDFAAQVTVGSEWSNQEGTVFAVVSMDTYEPGKYRVTWYGKDGFTGHMNSSDLKEIAKDIWSMMRTHPQPAPGSLDEFSTGPDWQIFRAVHHIKRALRLIAENASQMIGRVTDLIIEFLGQNGVSAQPYKLTDNSHYVPGEGMYYDWEIGLLSDFESDTPLRELTPVTIIYYDYEGVRNPLYLNISGNVQYKFSRHTPEYDALKNKIEEEVITYILEQK